MADYVVAEDLYHADWTKSIRYVEDDFGHGSVAADVFIFPGPRAFRSGIADRFNKLATEWQEETQYLSSTTQIVLHPAYQQIIGLGPAALPLIFQRLGDAPQHWAWALRAITGEDPTSTDDLGNMRAIREAWLGWARSHDYL